MHQKLWKVKWVLGKQSNPLSDTHVRHALRQAQPTSGHMKTGWIKLRIQNRIQTPLQIHRVYSAKPFSEFSFLFQILIYFSQYFKPPFAPIPLVQVVLLSLLPLFTPAHTNVILPFSVYCSSREESRSQMLSDCHGNTFILPELLNESRAWPPHES